MNIMYNYAYVLVPRAVTITSSEYTSFDLVFCCSAY